MIKKLSKRSLAVYSKKLAARHTIFAHVYVTYGTPPLWDRQPGFTTLLQIILEQQVSLASAKACYDKLESRLGHVTPENVLNLDEVEMKAVGFSRQKTAYARHLAEALIEKHIDLDSFQSLPDADVKAALMSLKGIGEWTSDIYLLMALLRLDVMPKGDIALHEAYRKLASIARRPDSDEFVELANEWSPYRSVAARFLWHFYLCEKEVLKKRNDEPNK